MVRLVLAITVIRASDHLRWRKKDGLLVELALIRVRVKLNFGNLLGGKIRL